MSYFRDSKELEGLLIRFLTSFLESAKGDQASKATQALSAPAVLELHLTDPDVTLSLDLHERTLLSGPAEDATVRLSLEASTLHDVLLDRLDPVQISRPFEEERGSISGRPEALAGLIPLVEPLADHYRTSLADQGREDLLATPEPPQAIVWQSEAPVKPLIGQRRPWQRPKPASRAGSAA